MYILMSVFYRPRLCQSGIYDAYFIYSNPKFVWIFYGNFVFNTTQVYVYTMQ